MDFLKRIPVHYKGELHDVRLINFTVALHELRDKVPGSIRLRDFHGKAVVSMVDVKLRKMRPVFLPNALTFNYRHVAFRVLVDDHHINGGVNKGIYFFRSFTDNPLIVFGGSLLTHYNLETARISDHNDEVIVQGEDGQVRYKIGDRLKQENDVGYELREMIGSLDRAYASVNGGLHVTQIQREKWPIERIECTGFANTFFQTAELLGAFRVFETIHYHWMPPKRIPQ